MLLQSIEKEEERLRSVRKPRSSIILTIG